MRAIIASAGWVAAMLTMAASTLLTIPLALGMRGKKCRPTAAPAAPGFTSVYSRMWYADILLALAAALINLPIREQPPGRPAALSVAKG